MADLRQPGSVGEIRSPVGSDAQPAGVLRHGLYCVGCCWVLSLLLFPIGVMNLAAMVAVAALVFAE